MMGTAYDRGFALPIAVFALAVMGAMVVASFVVALWDSQTSLATLRFVQTEANRDAALQGLIDGLGPSDLLSIPVDSTALRAVPATSGFSGVGLVRRLNSHSFAVMARDPGGSGVGRVVRIRPPTTVLVRPLSSPGAVQIGSGVVLAEGTPAGQFEDCADSTEFRVPPDFNAAAYEDRAAWAAFADKTIPGSTGPIAPGPSSSGRDCQRNLPTNWGDPASLAKPCGTYFPIIHWTGNLTVYGGTGQGILVVDGDLTVSGGFTFDGLVLVGGGLTIAGAGVRMTGAIQVDDERGKGSEVVGPSSLKYSRCALARSLLFLGRSEPLWQRGWFQDHK
jgi:hypothetical protein